MLGGSYFGQGYFGQGYTGSLIPPVATAGLTSLGTPVFFRAGAVTLLADGRPLIYARTLDAAGSTINYPPDMREFILLTAIQALRLHLVYHQTWVQAFRLHLVEHTLAVWARLLHLVNHKLPILARRLHRAMHYQEAKARRPHLVVADAAGTLRVPRPHLVDLQVTLRVALPYRVDHRRAPLRRKQRVDATVTIERP
jgi:hypothetical protein